jgi:hypothetical protein
MNKLEGCQITPKSGHRSRRPSQIRIEPVTSR